MKRFLKNIPETQKENLKQCEQVAASQNIGVDSQSKALQNENTDLFTTRCRGHLKTLSQKLMSAWLPPCNSEMRLRKLWRRWRDWKVITHWGLRIKRRKWSSESSSPTLSAHDKRGSSEVGEGTCVVVVVVGGLGGPSAVVERWISRSDGWTTT